jgi:hypothetical protein
MQDISRARLAAALTLAACGGEAPDASHDSGGRYPADAPGECAVLTAADIHLATGMVVKAVLRGSTPGAGGTCGNYVTAGSGELFLGINRLSSRREYAASVAAVPREVYPEKRALTGLGEEAVLFVGPGVRYLVARQGNEGIVIFPLVDERTLSDAQLRNLAERAMVR